MQFFTIQLLQRTNTTMTFRVFGLWIVLVCGACQSASPATPAETSWLETPSLKVTSTQMDTAFSEGESGAPGDGTFTLENVSQTKILHTLHGHTGQIIDFIFLPDDQFLSLGSDLTLRRWDINSGEEVNSLKLDSAPIYTGGISPVGDMFAIEGPNHLIQIRDSQDGGILNQLPGHTAFVMSYAFSLDDSLLATGDSNGSIITWEVNTASPVYVFAGHSSPIGALAFSPDNALLASGGVEGSHDIKIWDLASGIETISFNKHTGNVYDLAFSPDGTLLASASGDRTIKLWDIASEKELQTFSGHRGFVYSVEFSLDGKMLASSDIDGNIIFWEIATGKELKRVKGHTDLVEPIKFSKAGCHLASGSFDSNIIIWSACE